MCAVVKVRAAKAVAEPLRVSYSGVRRANQGDTKEEEGARGEGEGKAGGGGGGGGGGREGGGGTRSKPTVV